MLPKLQERVCRGHSGGPVQRYAIVAIGGSAGGLESVRTILHGLPADFASPIVVVLHLHPNYTSHAAEILRRQTNLDVKDAEDQETIANGRVYMAPRNRHLLVNRGVINLSETPAGKLQPAPSIGPSNRLENLRLASDWGCAERFRQGRLRRFTRY